MNQTVILGALELGGIFAILSLGLYISYKVLNLPDLTVDGSFALGCAVSGMFTINSMPYVGSVSYTHLDVYKRQIFVCRNGGKLFVSNVLYDYCRLDASLFC